MNDKFSMCILYSETMIYNYKCIFYIVNTVLQLRHLYFIYLKIIKTYYYNKIF